MKNKFHCLSLCAMTSIIGFAQAADDPRDAVISKLTQQTEKLSVELKNLQQEINHLQKSKTHKVKQHRVTTKTESQVKTVTVSMPDNASESNIDWLHGAPMVTTAPYFGVRSKFDASDLLVMVPSI